MPFHSASVAQMTETFASQISNTHDCTLIRAVIYAYAGLKNGTHGRHIRFLSMLGVHVALFWILSDLPKSGIHLHRKEISTVDKSLKIKTFCSQIGLPKKKQA